MLEIWDFGIRREVPCSDCWPDGHCSMNCGPAIQIIVPGVEVARVEPGWKWATGQAARTDLKTKRRPFTERRDQKTQRPPAPIDRGGRIVPDGGALEVVRPRKAN